MTTIALSLLFPNTLSSCYSGSTTRTEGGYANSGTFLRIFPVLYEVSGNDNLLGSSLFGKAIVNIRSLSALDPYRVDTPTIASALIFIARAGLIMVVPLDNIVQIIAPMAGLDKYWKLRDAKGQAWTRKKLGSTYLDLDGENLLRQSELYNSKSRQSVEVKSKSEKMA
ncbi:hypothetical protein EDD85DRAFT_784355 [Armillaria nabsnona]|nr:hypothetical protein EDD85DRAFT_784355 [Armillaria nabsnona]